VPEAILTKERELIAAQARHEGKPEKVIEKIVDGRVDSFYEDNVLYDQTFVNPEKYEGTVGQMVEMLAATMGENISVRRFARVGVGEVVE
jgi:elongation factor Ts